MQHEIESITNVIYSSPDNKGIDCVIKFVGAASGFPFTAREDDPEAQGRVLFEQLSSGQFGAVAPYVQG